MDEHTRDGVFSIGYEDFEKIMEGEEKFSFKKFLKNNKVISLFVIIALTIAISNVILISSFFATLASL